MIRIGPAGIPLSCKGRTLKDGIIYTKSLELDALEVQFVRGIRMSEEDAQEVGEVAMEADVELHVHAPYYTNLAGDERNLDLSRDKILRAAKLAHIMGAETVVVHPGFYGEHTPESAIERIAKVCADLMDDFKKEGWTLNIGLVTMGKKQVFGSLEEVVAVCQQVPGVVPVIDFPHIHARGNGALNTVEDFQEVFDKLIPLGLDHYLLHFAGVNYENGNERHHLPIKKGDLRFEPLVEVILENDYNVTVVSTSPILEHDAMYMQIVLDRVKEKRDQRMQKEMERKLNDEEEGGETSGDDAAPPAPPEPKPEPEPRPPCAAFTQAGDPCKNAARSGSKYCSSHKGYRPNKKAAQASSDDEGEAVEKPASKPAAEKKASKKAASAARSGSKTAKKAEAKSAGEAAQTEPPKKAAAKKVAAKKAPNKAAAKKPAAKKPAAKRPAAKKAAAKKSAAKKPAAKKAAAKKAAAKKSAAKKAAAKKSAAKKATKKSAAKKSTAKKATKKSASKKSAAKKSAASPTSSNHSSKTGSKKGIKNRMRSAVKSLTGRRGK